MFSVAEAARQYPFDSLASPSETLHRVPLPGPDHAFIVGVPMELQVLRFHKVFRNGDLDLEPMGRPAGPK